MGEKTDSIDEQIKEIVFDVEAGQLDPRLAVTRLCRLFKVHNRASKRKNARVEDCAILRGHP
jgi:hypothetical protein